MGDRKTTVSFKLLHVESWMGYLECSLVINWA